MKASNQFTVQDAENQKPTVIVGHSDGARRPPPPKPKRRRNTRKVKARQSVIALRTIEDFLNKIGGREALEKITSYKATGRAELKTASNVSIEGDGEIYWKSPNKIAEVIKVESIGEVREMFDGEKYFVQSEFTNSEETVHPSALEDKKTFSRVFMNY